MVVLAPSTPWPARVEPVQVDRLACTSYKSLWSVGRRGSSEVCVRKVSYKHLPGHFLFYFLFFLSFELAARLGRRGAGAGCPVTCGCVRVRVRVCVRGCPGTPCNLPRCFLTGVGSNYAGVVCSRVLCWAAPGVLCSCLTAPRLVFRGWPCCCFAFTTFTTALDHCRIGVGCSYWSRGSGALITYLTTFPLACMRPLRLNIVKEQNMLAFCTLSIDLKTAFIPEF